MLYPWSLLAGWVFHGWEGHSGRFIECSVDVLFAHSSVVRSPIHVLLVSLWVHLGDKSVCCRPYTIAIKPQALLGVSSLRVLSDYQWNGAFWYTAAEGHRTLNVTNRLYRDVSLDEL